ITRVTAASGAQSSCSLTAINALRMLSNMATFSGFRRPPCCQRTAAVWTSAWGGGKTPTSAKTTRPPMKQFLLRLFTWWNGQTFGTQLWTWLYGEAVGEDEYGNRYYRTRGGKIDKSLGFQRRWVIYNGYAEASVIPPSWHGWMHHTVDV